MTKFALFVRLGKPGQEAAVAAFLAGALHACQCRVGH